MKKEMGLVNMKVIQKTRSQVPGQYLGYSLQATRFLVKLLEAEPGWTVSLEVFGDVGVETADGHQLAGEVKSTHGGNPVSDRSVDLWKTFSNWIDAVKRGDLQLEKTSFEIYVSQPRTGEIVSSFRDANSLDEAHTALTEAKNKLWGTAPDFNLKSNVSDTIKPYVSNVFETDETLVCRIIVAFSLDCGSGSPHADLKVLMGKKFVPPEIIDETLDHALGWVKKRTDILLEQTKTACISVDTFLSNMIRFVRKHDHRDILASFAKDPDQEEIETDLKLRTYVRQLEIIDCNYDDKIRAVTDFLNASVDRTRWGEKGWVSDSSFDEFEDGLVRTWTNLKRKTDIRLSHKDDIEKGQYLYADCSNHKAKLEGLEIPNHFTPGSFHALSDEEAVGWHPDYKDKLKNVVKREQ
ncbi:MAG: hypothetical protein KAT13_03410 [Methanosarcinales archaeon]|nr:hypothetical protein [Methanosarcinales archaeon]